MNFNATIIVYFVQILVICSSVAVLVRYLRIKPSNSILIPFGATLCLLGFAFALTLSWIENPHWTKVPDPGPAAIDIASAIGTFIILVAFYHSLKISKQSPNAIPISSPKSPNGEPAKTTPVAVETLRKALEQSEQRFLTILKHGAAAYLIVDQQLNIQKANNAFATMIRQNLDQLIGHPMAKWVMESDKHLLKQLFFDKVKDKSASFSLEIRMNSNEQEPLWVKISPRIISLEANKQSLLLYFEDIREAKNLAELISFHSQYDELTMLHNREGLEKYLANSLDESLTTDEHIAVIYFDIDQLKVVNDTCGFAAGDSLIQHLVTVIGRACEERDFYARLGGDEFAVVKRSSSIQQAKRIAESMRSAAEDFPFTWKDNDYRLSISLGVALSSDQLSTVVDILGAADSACSTAKETGKNRVSVYSESMESAQDSRRDMMWVSRLQKAIQNSQFELYFQPIEKLNSPPNEHVHYEFLIRYIDESGKHINPHHFLPAVEKFGLSEQIDLWVLTTALDYLDKNPQHTEVLNCCSINLTSQSIANPRIRSAVLQVVQSYNFPTEKICFEITESSAIQNLKEAKDFIRELKTLGCHLALDDFGTGFSSFDYLKNLDVDYIKIDGSFVKDILTDRFDRAMVSAITNMGLEMEIETIAEYAENLSIMKVLEDMGVNYAQGHGIAKPMPITSLDAYYASARKVYGIK